jgi:chromosome segregation ATPase
MSDWDLWNTMSDAQRMATWREACDQLAEAQTDVRAFRAEVARLRGIVQADLEEKSDAWGESERLKGAIEAYEADAVAYRAEVERLKSELFNANFLLGEEKRDRQFAQIELRNYKAELRRVTGPREPPHCPTCDCPGPSPGTGA